MNTLKVSFDPLSFDALPWVLVPVMQVLNCLPRPQLLPSRLWPPLRSRRRRNRQVTEAEAMEAERSAWSCCRSTFIHKYVAQSCLGLNLREASDCRRSTRLMAFVVVLRPLVDRLSHSTAGLHVFSALC